MGWFEGGHMGLMWIFWPIGIIMMVAFVYWIAKGTTSNSSVGPMKESPEQVLKRKYAGGVIDRAEYEQKLEDIRR